MPEISFAWNAGDDQHALGDDDSQRHRGLERDHITRTYYQSTISDELLEAAQLDGCSDARFIWQIVVPLSGAITAVNTLFYAVGHWNAFFNAFIYLNDDRLFPLQIVLREILIANDIDLELTGDVIDDEARQGLRELLRFSLIVGPAYRC